MRYVSINTVPNGSTGVVMRSVTEERRALGDECWCMWGRGRAAENDYEFNFGNKVEFYADVLQTRIIGRAGFHSKRATRRLLAQLDEIRPDVIHLHNLHGYYVNIEMLFRWLVEHEEVRVRWTLHDCWAFTGQCTHFTYMGCDRWCKGTCDAGCLQLSIYPKTISRGSCAWSFEHKRACFTRLSVERMTLVTPSHWLESLVNKSFLAKYPVEVRYNTVDNTVFKPTPSDFRERYGIGNRFMVLGVASPWTERKGLGDFVRLAGELDRKEYAVVLVGLSKRQVKEFSKTLIALPKTESAVALAEAYTAADVHLQPSVEETFGMTVVESYLCDTPTIVTKGSACVEAALSCGRVPVEVIPTYQNFKEIIIDMHENRNVKRVDAQVK